MNTKLSSIIDGLNTVRAYKKETYFIDGFVKASDINGTAIFTFFGVSRHLAILLDL